MGRQPASIRQARSGLLWAQGILAAVGLGLAVWFVQANHRESLRETTIMQAVGGDAERGIPAMIRNGCGGCHEIPGVPGAQGTVGPSLRGVAQRTYAAGTVLRTSPDAMMRWISRARDVDPRTAMPNTNLSEQEARDITAYLYART
ncbi:c-type cytochrome [Mesorhizobium sp. M1050]|uniref:c-type cytochrome n=1 Tax=unclassified Mesorhizobium TaxID=325217 RepID=UPI00333D74EC